MLSRVRLRRIEATGRAPGIALSCIALCCLVQFTAVVHAQPGQAAENGRYLAILGDCTGCHTVRPDAPFAGGEAFSGVWGTVYSSNITPDRKTGIGDWTSQQFWHAMHDGVSANGSHLYPGFPYLYFTHISRADSDAIFAYLRTLKSVRYAPPSDRLVFPLNIRALMRFWNTLFLSRAPFKPDATKSIQWNRGNYIVNGLGHCGECHTPKNVMFGDETDRKFTGAREQGWFSANLTGSVRDGLGSWSVADIAAYLKTGRNGRALAVGSMQDVVSRSTSKMTDADREAIAAYLKSLPPAAERQPASPNAASMAAGRAIFVARCSACHAATEYKGDYPPLAHNTLIAARDPVTVVRVILDGCQSAPTDDPKVAYSMPAFPVLSDADIADVATFIRNSWGNKASPVTAAQVAGLRQGRSQ